MAAVWLMFICVTSSLAFLTKATSTVQKQLLVQFPLTDGQSEIYGKNLDGLSVKVALFQPQAGVAVVALVADANRMVKSEFDAKANLIDCEIIDNQFNIRRFADHVEEKVEKALGSRSHFQMRETTVGNGVSVFDLEAQLKSCGKLIQDRDVNEEAGKRSKRSYLIWPGTNWCGKGSKAEFADSYGPNKETDQCCKKHDQCPYIIDGFTTRYNLFNYRVHTLSHCDCDIPFMTCLKAANTTTAAMVGKVYFNVVNTECFELKLQKTCVRRSWWGGCEKYSTKWAATVKNLGNFPE